MAIKDRDQVELFIGETATDHAKSHQKRQRRPEEKGLPEREARFALAATFLDVQHRLWPEVAALGFLPSNSKASKSELAQTFADQFLSDEAVVANLKCAQPPWQTLGGCYLRYSDDNSNPRSLDQQLFNVLERARRENVFIPWEYVFADAAVTGTIASRRGYEAAKELIQRKDNSITHLFIDEIGRVSRNAIEAMKLGRLVNENNKHLIGISDGFDSQSPQSKLMLSVFATLQEWFVDQLRSKVNRGMRDAFERGRNIQPPCLGYTMVPLLDVEGEPALDLDKNPLNQKVIDPQQAQWVLTAFRLYAEEQWSPGKISRLFNKHKVGDVQTWDGSRIRKLLRRRVYIGIEIYRMTRQVRDPETGKVIEVKRPRADWLVRRSRHLKIVSMVLWKKTHKRLLECSGAYSAKSTGEQPRTTVYPTTLFRPICGYCGKVLWLGRSGKYSSFCCINGRDGKHGCQLRTYKSVRILETILLDYLKETLFTDAFLDEVLTAANHFLLEEAKRPKEDTLPLRHEIQSVEKKRNKLKKILDQEGDTDFDTLVAQIRRWEQQLKELRERLHSLETRNVGAPPPMEMADVEQLLGDLRDVLDQDIETAAPLLQELTGPIEVVQAAEQTSKGKGTAWIASFTVNVVPVLVKLATSKGCPSAGTWEYLNTRNRTILKAQTVVVHAVPKYEALAPQILALYEQGSSVSTIALTHKISTGMVQHAFDFARTGQRPKSSSGRATGAKQNAVPKYQLICKDVVRLRDQEHMSWARIRKFLKQNKGIDAGIATIVRAYDEGHPEQIEAARQTGAAPIRGSYRNLSADVFQEIWRRLEAGEKPPTIAAIVGCSASTVRREAQRLRKAA